MLYATLTAFALGYIAAAVQLMLYRFYSEGMILSWYYHWLLRQKLDSKPLGMFAKPLGLCVYCQGVWVAWGILALYTIRYPFSWWYVVVVPAIALKLIAMWLKHYE